MIPFRHIGQENAVYKIQDKGCMDGPTTTTTMSNVFFSFAGTIDVAENTTYANGFSNTPNGSY